MRYIFYILSIAISAEVYSQEMDSVLTLEEAIDLTLENNFQIKIQKNQSNIAENDNSIGNAGYLPVIDARSDYNRSIQNTQQEFVSGNTQEVPNARRQVFSAGVDLNWTLFDGTVMFVRKDRLENQSLQAYYTYKSQIDQQLSLLMSLYYSVALEQGRSKLFDSNINFSEERLRIVEQKYELGKESRLAFLQARVDLNSDQSAAIQQQELLTSTRLQLMEVMALMDLNNFSVESDIQIDTTLVLSELLETSRSKNPQLLAEELEFEITKQEKEEVSRAALPQIDANVSYDYSNLNSEAGFLLSNQTRGLNYGVSARMNLFNGFNRRRQIQNAEVQIEMGQFQLDQLRNAIEAQLRNTFNTYSNNLNLSRIEYQNLEVAKENAEIALERFKLGVSDALEVREAQVNSVNAQIRYLQSVFQAKQAEITLKRLAGTLSVMED